MLIGELAEAVGLTSQTIRFYERRGLLPAPHRAANGYRAYDDSSVFRVLFIRSAQSAGLTLTTPGQLAVELYTRTAVRVRFYGCTRAKELST